MVGHLTNKLSTQRYSPEVEEDSQERIDYALAGFGLVNDEEFFSFGYSGIIAGAPTVYKPEGVAQPTELLANWIIKNLNELFNSEELNNKVYFLPFLLNEAREYALLQHDYLNSVDTIIQLCQINQYSQALVEFQRLGRPQFVNIATVLETQEASIVKDTQEVKVLSPELARQES